jgi:type II secretory pathway component PulF
LPNFRYTARDKDGKAVSGVMDSANSASLVDVLRQKELTIISIEEVREKAKTSMSIGGDKASPEDLVIFSRQLATMVDAGIPLVGALDALQDQMERAGFKNIVKKVRDNVEGGLSLSESLSKQPNVFSPFFINMVRAGSQAATSMRYSTGSLYTWKRPLRLSGR